MGDGTKKRDGRRQSRLILQRVIFTHPDQDHRLAAQILLKGDVGQQIRFLRGYDIDMVAYPNDLVQVPHHGSRKKIHSVPVAGGILLGYVCAPDRLEVVLGDLEQNFRKRAMKYGIAAAHRWYWWQVARSIGAFFVKLLQSAELIHQLLIKLGLL
jgi:hypothetical protein